MGKKSQSFILGFLMIIFLLISGFTQQKPNGYITDEQNDEVLFTYNEKTLESRFGFMHPEHIEELPNLGAFWQRPHAGPFIWGKIETSSNAFDWANADKEMKNSQKYGVNILATIWPFADWDQSNCNEKLPSADTQGFHELGNYRGKPCDIDGYQQFVQNLVERYDGDGIDDMPGLLYPIKYWEVSNEPSMQNGLVFFKGTSQDYVDILKATHKGVKEADNQAFVILGGMAGVSDDMKSFWNEVYDLGADEYFDFANIHYIGHDSDSINAEEYTDYLIENDIDVSFWITEAEFIARSFGADSYNDEEWAAILVKSYIRAFSNGAEKIFYVGLEQSPGDEGSWLIKGSDKQASFYSFQTMIDKIDYFSSIETLVDNQYKIMVDNTIVYVLWGTDDISDEITGDVAITDIKGNIHTMDASEIVLSEDPVFVEII